MKQLTLAACLLFAGVVANAQVQIRGGVNRANISIDNDGNTSEANRLTSFQVGVLKDFKLGTSLLNLQSGLLYTGKGSKVQSGTAGQSGYYRQSFNPRYLELPVNLIGKVPLGGGSRLFFGAGPYVAVGIGGSVETEGNLAGANYSWEGDIEFSDDDPTTFNNEEGSGFGIVRRFDYGLNGTAGLEFKTFVLGVNYGLGLAKLQSGTSSGADNNNKHRVWSFTLGYKF